MTAWTPHHNNTLYRMCFLSDSNMTDPHRSECYLTTARLFILPHCLSFIPRLFNIQSVLENQITSSVNDDYPRTSDFGCPQYLKNTTHKDYDSVYASFSSYTTGFVFPTFSDCFRMQADFFNVLFLQFQASIRFHAGSPFADSWNTLDSCNLSQWTTGVSA